MYRRSALHYYKTAIYKCTVSVFFFCVPCLNLVGWVVARCTRADVDWLYILRDSGLSWLAGVLPGVYTPMVLDWLYMQSQWSVYVV